LASGPGPPDAQQEHVMTAVRNAMPPELVNRIDDVVMISTVA
jgi:hypothetical protein